LVVSQEITGYGFSGGADFAPDGKGRPRLFRITRQGNFRVGRFQELNEWVVDSPASRLTEILFLGTTKTFL
jgi:hypothetical protein